MFSTFIIHHSPELPPRTVHWLDAAGLLVELLNALGARSLRIHHQLALVELERVREAPELGAAELVAVERMKDDDLSGLEDGYPRLA